MNRILLFLMLWLCINSQAQQPEDFEGIVDKGIEKLYQDPEECIQFTQSILITEKDVDHRMILQNVLSQAYAMKGDFIQSIRISLDNDGVMLNHSVPSTFALMYLDYALSEHYQNLNLFKQSENQLHKIFENQKFHQKYPNYIITLAKVYQLHAINLSYINEAGNAWRNFEKSQQNLTLKTEENWIIQTENEIFKATLLIQQRQLIEARNILERQLKLIESKSDYRFLKALALERLARVYFMENNFSTALNVQQQALQTIQDQDYMVLKTKLYEGIAKSNLALGNDANYKHFNERYLETKSKIDSNSKEGIRYLVKLTNSHEEKLTNVLLEKENIKSIWIGATIGGIIWMLSMYVWMLYRKRQEFSKQLEFLNQQNKMIASPGFTEIIGNDLEKMTKKQRVIPIKKEKELLNKLNEFENSDRFLSKDMSLAVLAGQLETNTKYLSEVINKYKGKNFNYYINELRVNHIAYLLKTDANYLNYKVSYLAEVGGFTSHSSFTTIFKSITGMSPNTYIQKINPKK